MFDERASKEVTSRKYYTKLLLFFLPKLFFPSYSITHKHNVTIISVYAQLHGYPIPGTKCLATRAQYK